MSGESMASNSRKLSAAERNFISVMLSASGKPRLIDCLLSCEVFPLQDGRMGSLRFYDSSAKHRTGTQLAEAQFYDADGTIVSAVLTTDEKGRLFELDLWRVDFGALQRLPDPKDINLLQGAGTRSEK